MLIFLSGKESFLVHQRLMELKADFLQKNPSASVVSFDLDEEFDEVKIKEGLACGGGLFCRRKMTIFKDPFSLSEGEQEALGNILKKLDLEEKTQFLVLAQLHKAGKQGKLGAFLKKKARAEKFEPLEGAKLEGWIRARVGEETDGQGTIKGSAIGMLALFFGNDLWRLMNEIKKLASNKPVGEITKDDVERHCQGKLSAKIFDLVDAVGSKNLALAIGLKNQLIFQGEDQFYIFSMIMFQIRNLAKISGCVRTGVVQPEMIGRRTGLHPYVVKKTLYQLKNFTRDKLRRTYALAAEIDERTKTGDYEMESALDYFLCKI